MNIYLQKDIPTKIKYYGLNQCNITKETKRKQLKAYYRLIVILIVNSLLENLDGNHLSLSLWCVLLSLLLIWVYAQLLVAFFYKDIPVDRNEKEDNSTRAHVIFKGVWFNRFVTNQERYLSTALADKHIS